MDKMQEMLEGRFATNGSQKVKALAKQSSDGRLTGFSGLFKIIELADMEKANLEAILHKHAPDSTCDIEKDFAALSNITAEIKAITNQAAILHGERIMRAQKILKSYQEGAFSAWLLATYGNRQTPYNFLLYYELYEQLPPELKNQAERLPRQAMYTLASRDAPLEKKKALIAEYKGETKQQMLERIRLAFPLSSDDKRRENPAQSLLLNIERLVAYYKKHEEAISEDEKHQVITALKKILFFVSAK
jgi:hypothetical protein